MEKKTREDEINVEIYGFQSTKYIAYLQKIFRLKTILTKQDLIYFCLLISTIPDSEFRKILNFSRITHRCWKVLKSIPPFNKLLENFSDKEVLNDYKNLMYLDVIKKFGPELILRLYEEHYDKYKNIKKISEVQNTLEKIIPYEIEKPIPIIEKFKEEIKKYSLPTYKNEFVQIYSDKFIRPKIIIIEHKPPEIKLIDLSKIFSYLNSNFVNKESIFCKDLIINGSALSNISKDQIKKFNKIDRQSSFLSAIQNSYNIDEKSQYMREFSYSKI